MRSMTTDICSGSLTREQSANQEPKVSKPDRTVSPVRQNLRDATLRMSRALKSIPDEVKNRWYGFSRSECHYSTGHLMGSWPEIADSFARHGSPEADVMAPAYEVRNQLRREVYRKALPPLQTVEEMEAEVVFKIQKAEIGNDVRSLKEAAREEVIIAELLEEAADRAGR